MSKRKSRPGGRPIERRPDLMTSMTPEMLTEELSTWMSIGEVARYLEVSPQTVLNLKAQGKLKPAKCSLGELYHQYDVYMCKEERRRGKEIAESPEIELLLKIPEETNVHRWNGKEWEPVPDPDPPQVMPS